MGKKRIEIINGPNLNMLGRREVSLYGNRGFDIFYKDLAGIFPGFQFDYFQSNIEGEIVTRLQQARDRSDAVIINPAAYTHTSVAIADALALLDIPIIEVHITNIYSREEFRHTSLTGRYANGIIMGMGLEGYSLAVRAIESLIGGYDLSGKQGGQVDAVSDD